ncbi:hypothetical protein F5Y13DRAFT_201925 [Hypoxylon sp. FL1857]|nr:hypothetical protein F5Y13DRAFT_201925 [Hypoxylon sp. FL1857]
MSPDASSLTPAQENAIWDGAAATPPEGTTSNFEHPTNKNSIAISVASICLFLGTVVFLIRAYAKIFRAKRCRIEDYLGFLAFCVFVCHIYTVFALVHYPGFFVHQWDLQLRDFVIWLKTVKLNRVFYFLAIALAKNAILLEWVHIFVPYPTRNLFFWTCRILMVSHLGLALIGILISYLSCIPPASEYTPWIHGTCINLKAADIAIMSFHLFTDLIILILPQKVIWSLNLEKTRRIGVSIIFSLGILTCVCAIGRVYSVAVADYRNDSVYTVSLAIMWAIGEHTGMLFVFCIPAAPKAFGGNDDLLPRLGRLFSTRAWMSRLNLRGRRTKQHWRAANLGNLYQKMDGSGSGQIPLTDLERTPVSQQTTASSNNRSILKTTEFTAEEAMRTQFPIGEDMERQHPWMNNV